MKKLKNSPLTPSTPTKSTTQILSFHLPSTPSVKRSRGKKGKVSHESIVFERSLFSKNTPSFTKYKLPKYAKK